MPKISQYPSMSAPTGAEIFIGDQAGVTSTATGNQLAAFSQGGIAAVDTGAANAYILTTTKPIQSLAVGTIVSFFPVHPNTGPSTVNVNGGGNLAIVDSALNALTGGELIGPVLLQYTGSQWALSWNLPLANKRTTAEIAAGVTPVNYAYAPGDPRRYATAVQWSAVYAQVTNLTYNLPGWYRGDHAQHPSASNTIIGLESYDDSLLTGTVGYRCTAVGFEALQSNNQSTTAGGSNCAFGFGSLQSNVEGSGNCAFGPLTMNALPGTPGSAGFSHNNAFGYRVLSALINGVQNHGFGFEALNSLTTGNNNHGFGHMALTSLLQGSGNVSLGYQCLFSRTYGDYDIAIGYNTLFSSSAVNVSGITQAASAVVTLSTVSTINPLSAGCTVELYNVSGMTQINGVIGQVTAIGGSSGAWTVTVNINSSAFSAYTGGGQVAPVGNIAIGATAGFDVAVRGGNTLLGYQVCSQAEPGTNNTVIGFQAAEILNCNGGTGTADYNVVVGYQAALRMTGGNSNVVVGQQAGNFITSGNNCVVVGPNAGQAITTVINNTMVGSITGVNLNGNSNTALGYNAGSTVAAQTFTNTTSLGANAIPGQSGDFTLGDSGVTRLRCQQTTITSLSDVRFKTDIRALDISAESFADLNPVVFRWIEGAGPDGEVMGFVAQELDRWQTRWGLEWMELVSKANPDRWEATPMKLFFPLLKHVQSMESRLQRLEALLVP